MLVSWHICIDIATRIARYPVLTSLDGMNHLSTVVKIKKNDTKS